MVEAEEDAIREGFQAVCSCVDVGVLEAGGDILPCCVSSEIRIEWSVQGTMVLTPLAKMRGWSEMKGMRPCCAVQ